MIDPAEEAILAPRAANGGGELTVGERPGERDHPADHPRGQQRETVGDCLNLETERGEYTGADDVGNDGGECGCEP